MLECFEYAVWYLSRYPKSTYELRMQLHKKWYVPDEIDQAIDKLTTKWYLNDTTYTELYLNSEVAKKWKPLAVCIAKLRQKWIDKEIISQVCESREQDLRQWSDTKLRREIEKLTTKWLTEHEMIQKLASRGYKIDHIRQLFRAQSE